MSAGTGKTFTRHKTKNLRNFDHKNLLPLSFLKKHHTLNLLRQINSLKIIVPIRFIGMYYNGLCYEGFFIEVREKNTHTQMKHESRKLMKDDKSARL